VAKKEVVAMDRIDAIVFCVNDILLGGVVEYIFHH
jgi:hypothetical protein